MPRRPWWIATPPAPDEMMYDCDAKFGTPSPANCSHIEYSQVGAPSDTLNISPGVPKVISSGMCSVAVSTAAASITISWQQVQVALEALIDMCISNPGRESTGGTAYYGSEVVLPRGTRRARGAKPNLTGKCGLLHSFSYLLLAAKRELCQV